MNVLMCEKFKNSKRKQIRFNSSIEWQLSGTLKNSFILNIYNYHPQYKKKDHDIDNQFGKK